MSERRLPVYDGMDPRTYEALEAVGRDEPIRGSHVGVLSRWGYIERSAAGWMLTEHGKRRLGMGHPLPERDG